MDRNRDQQLQIEQRNKNRTSRQEQIVFRDRLSMYLSAVTNADIGDDEVQDIPLKEDVDFQKAVEEVKDAALNVTESSVKLTSTIVTKGPGIFMRLLKTVLSKEFRCVSSLMDCSLDDV